MTIRLAARDFLIGIGFGDQEAYRIIQTAGWMTLRPTPVGEQMRKGISSPDEAIEFLGAIREERRNNPIVSSIQEIISEYRLKFIPALEPTVEQIEAWNVKLYVSFTSVDVLVRWNKIFESAFVRTFKNEDVLFKEIIGE